MSNENPTNSREVFDENEAGIAQKKQEITDAVTAGDYGKVAELAQEAKAMETAKGEMINSARDEATEVNKGIDEAKAAEEKAAREAALAEQARQDAEKSQQEADALLEKMNGGASETNNSESKGELPPEVQEIIKKMTRIGYYKNELPNLKPGEVPSPELASKMISSILDDFDFPIESAEILIKNLPFDSEFVKDSVARKIIEQKSLNERKLKEMELVGIDPKSLHDQAKESLSGLLWSVAGDRGEMRKPEFIKTWKETFGISDEEYVGALHSYWQEHTNRISDKHLQELGFLRTKDGRTNWAWES